MNFLNLTNVKTKTCFYLQIITDHLLKVQNWVTVVIDSKEILPLP